MHGATDQTETLQSGPPGIVRLTEELGLAFPERDYLVWDPFEGERDTGIRCQTTTLRRARRQYVCLGLLGEQDHEIKPGSLYRHEKGLADGRWGYYRLCIGCMDKWLTEIGRQRTTSPNAELSGPPAPNEPKRGPAEGGSA